VIIAKDKLVSGGNTISGNIIDSYNKAVSISPYNSTIGTV
jgi:hypothetical protein